MNGVFSFATGEICTVFGIYYNYNLRSEGIFIFESKKGQLNRTIFRLLL